MYLETDPEFVKKVLESFYVDDLVSGEITVDKAFQLYDKTMSRMAQGGFKLRKWSTNSNILESKIKVHETDQCEIKHIVENMIINHMQNYPLE